MQSPSSEIKSSRLTKRQGSVSSISVIPSKKQVVCSFESDAPDEAAKEQAKHVVSDISCSTTSETASSDHSTASGTSAYTLKPTMTGRTEAAVCAATAREAESSLTASKSLVVDSESFDDYLGEDYQQKLQQLPRQWELTEFGAHHQSATESCSNSRRPIEFTIMTYNILSQDLLEYHPYLYSRSDAQSLDWQQRRRRLVAEIAYHCPDILSLQEVHKDHFFEYIKPRLENLGYSGSYHKKSGDKRDGCATLWKKDRFHLLRATPVDYCRGGLLDRDNIALIVELQPIRDDCEQANISLQTQDKVVVANTHVLFNPRRGDIKLAQLMILLAEIDKCAYLGPSPDAQHLGNLGWWDATKTEHYCPVIVTGDFNMEPQCELYKFLIGGLIDYEDLLVREMAGQEEGSYGRNCWLQRDFFSPLYGVSDFCQYHTLVVERLRQSYQMYSETALASCIRSDGSQFDQLYIQDSHSSYLDTNPGDIGKHQHVMCLESQSNAHTPGCWQTEGIHHLDYPPLMPSSTGRLSHRLNLISAYQHKIQRLNDEAEVTTHHNRAECTVDYIFYSVDHKDACVQDEEIQMNIIEEGHLKLIGRYGLMSGTELDDMGGIPNPTLPSDHLCLIAHFLLQ